MSQQYASKQPSGYNNHIRNVAIVGAAGQQGKFMVEALLKTGKHTVTAITRAESSSEPVAGVKVAKIDYNSPDTIVEALKGQDALIITMSVTAPREQSIKLVEAAAKAGVPWIVPDEWGVDTTNEQLGKDVLIGPAKVAIRELIEKLGVSSWIGVANSFWYEYSLGTMADMYGFDFQNKAVTFFDDGEEKITTTTWEQVARTVVAIMSMKILPDDENDKSPSLDRDLRNKFAHVNSFTVSQKDMFESVKRVTGDSDSDWKISYEKSDERFAEASKRVQAGDFSAFVKLLYTRVFYPTGEGNQEARFGLENDLLGLPKEDLDTCTKKAIERSNMAAKSQ